MNFFRLRVINTLLFFLIGAVIGFILKDRLFPHREREPRARYQPEYAAAEAEPGPGADETFDEEPEPEPADHAAAPRQARETPKPGQVEIETSVLPGEQPAPAEEKPSAELPAQSPGKGVIKDAQDDFFASPENFIGKDLEVELQMITARRSPRGWRLNFVYSGPDKKIDYLYADDTDVLGEKPDLRIGYVYRVRFHCGKGDASSGNTLLLLTPTGEKAAWATGLSAIE